MPDPKPMVPNKYRAAIEVLHHGRDVLVESLANEILDQGETLIEGGFLFNEFLESQGTRLHFLGLLVSHLEQSAEALEGASLPPPPPPKPPAKRRTRTKTKKVEQQTAKKKSAEEL